jgi:hypothetical protein
VGPQVSLTHTNQNLLEVQAGPHGQVMIGMPINCKKVGTLKILTGMCSAGLLVTHQSAKYAQETLVWQPPKSRPPLFSDLCTHFISSSGPSGLHPVALHPVGALKRSFLPVLAIFQYFSTQSRTTP